ncbi:STAS domain-containing protein [Desulfogranum japonicum]|uniref:STAS domain-containing protein n=1 Tax=Desulfogranum japonicum TaxID=231447 RepID=UPI000411B1EB|nr:STAS domain-containing protein [Desulfogranum japonicum]
MPIQSSQVGDVTRVRIDDRLEADTVQEFRNAMSRLADEGNIKIVLDFGNVSFVDSSGLGCIVSALRQFRQYEGDIKLACITDNIRPLIEIVRLHRVFDIYDSAEEAVKSFG